MRDNPLFGGPLGAPVFGTQIIEDPNYTEPYEDWSQVRSPSRAKRRRRKHPQRIVVRQVPRRDALMLRGGRTMVMHPVTADAIRRHLDSISGSSA